MTSFLCPAAPLAILQADNTGKRTPEEIMRSQLACTQWKKMQSLTSCLDDSQRPFPPFAQRGWDDMGEWH